MLRVSSSGQDFTKYTDPHIGTRTDDGAAHGAALRIPFLISLPTNCTGAGLSLTRAIDQGLNGLRFSST